MSDYQEAFDEAMMEGERPCLILIWIASEVPEVPYGSRRIQKTFMWRVAYMKEEIFSLFEPLQNFIGGKYLRLPSLSIIGKMGGVKNWICLS